MHGVLDWLWPPALLALVIWMGIQAHRRLRSRTRRWLLYPVLAVTALAAVGGGYATVGAAADARAYPRPGQLIDVGGHSLHLNCTGSGSPTVVLQPGGGEMSSNMGWIAPAVARGTRVCVYDRAGRGWSEPADAPQDAAQIATDLHTLLQRANVPGPYVLAGHSFGGLYVLTYAAHYPDEVAGMVLVDSTNRASAARATTASPYDGGSYNALGRFSALISSTARLGLARLYGQIASSSLPPQSEGEVLATIGDREQSWQHHRRVRPSERLRAGSCGTARLRRQAARRPDSRHRKRRCPSAAQEELATLSTNNSHRVIDSDHEGLINNEKGAAATTQAILDVIRAARSHAALH